MATRPLIRLDSLCFNRGVGLNYMYREYFLSLLLYYLILSTTTVLYHPLRNSIVVFSVDAKVDLNATRMLSIEEIQEKGVVASNQ